MGADEQTIRISCRDHTTGDPATLIATRVEAGIALETPEAGEDGAWLSVDDPGEMRKFINFLDEVLDESD